MKLEGRLFYKLMHESCKQETIRIHHECESGLEKSVPQDHRLSSLSFE